MTEVCSVCGSSARPEARFCKTCGNSLQSTVSAASAASDRSTCAQCGAELVPRARYCRDCGYEATSTTTPVRSDPSRAPPIPGPNWSTRAGTSASKHDDPYQPSAPRELSPIAGRQVGTAHTSDNQRRPNRMFAVWLYVGIAILLLGGGVAAVVLHFSSHNSTRVDSETSLSPAHIVHPTTTSQPTDSTPTTETTTQTSVTTTTTFDTSTAELQSGWVSDPTKCGPQQEPALGQTAFQVTATIHVWSQPTTTSTPLSEITVTSYGPGGIGCPTGTDPIVQVQCVAQGQQITGPFSTDPYWERVTWDGLVGYVPDEWINTQSATSSLPTC